MKKKGFVYLVGAGPGDPGLLTLKGADCLRRADVVVYDYLANERLLAYAPSPAKKIYVGKKGSSHTLEQSQIEALLIREARQGKIVTRLKGGDPFVFGRGGEEAEALAGAGIGFEVVPGITSAIAAPAYGGIPVTHRDFTPAVAFVTGHEKDEEGAMSPDWKGLSRIGTVVFLMGVGNLPLICRNLTQAGKNPKTPVGVIQWGTLPRQRKVLGTLETIVDRVREAGIVPPAVTIVGEVVSLSNTLDWFGQRPLFGRRILVTRSRDQASQLSRQLEELGAEAIEIPTIEIRPPRNFSGLDRAIRLVATYHWIIFTSVNGVEAFFGRLARLGDLRDLKGIQIAAIGPATAESITKKGIRVDLVAKEFRAEGILGPLGKRVRGKRILIPRAREAREILVTGLKRFGARVDLVEAYCAVLPPSGKKALQRILEGPGIDLITVASSSTVENFVTMAGRTLMKRLRRIPVASIGPITTQTAKRLKLNVVIQPRRYTIPDLTRSVVAYFSKKRGTREQGEGC